MSPEPISAEMPDLNAIADQLLQTARVTKIRSQSDTLRVNDCVDALKRALAPDVEDIIFADGDIIAWRMPEMMTTETVHRTAVYLERRRLWLWGDGNVLGPIEKLLQSLRCEGVSDICYIPARDRIPLT